MYAIKSHTRALVASGESSTQCVIWQGSGGILCFSVELIWTLLVRRILQEVWLFAAHDKNEGLAV